MLTLAIVAGGAVAQQAFVKVGLETVYDAGYRCGVPYWAVADINRDGSPDIYVSSISGGSNSKLPYLLVNDGGGNFTYSQSRLAAIVADESRFLMRSRTIDAVTTYASSEAFTGALFADVDRDGFPDLIVLPVSTTPTGLLFLNDGTGDFSKATPIELPPGRYGGGWMVLVRNPDGGYVFPYPQSPGPATDNLDAKAVDVNGDGYPDLMILQTQTQVTPDFVDYRGSRIQILINQGGKFTRSTLDGVPADGLYVVMPGGVQQPTRIVNVQFRNRLDPNGIGLCTLAVQTYERSAYSAYSGAYVEKAYAAYYGRPADPAGEAYWAIRMDAEGHSLDSIIGAFGRSDEFNRRYGALSDADLVTKIYQQTLGRDPDPAGRAYYVGELRIGRRTLQSITLDVLNGATTAPDSTVVANKLDVAGYYATKVATGCAYGTEQDGVNITSGVTANPATVTAAKAAIDSRCGS